jgi:hypothetical protein
MIAGEAVMNARSLAERKRDALHRLTQDVDVWVATAAGDIPYLVPLSFLWDGETLLLSTAATTPTGRNLQANGNVRLSLGGTRDLVLIEGTVDTLRTADKIPTNVGDAFAAKTGFDPRRLRTPYLYFRIAPHRIQVWREENELAGRDIMLNGAWLADH